MKRPLFSFFIFLLSLSVSATDTTKPWTFWYWMYGAVSEQGIRADLQAMKDVGLGGCYLMPIRGTEQAPANLPQLGKAADGNSQMEEALAQQLSPRFWQMVDVALAQADSLGLQMGIHICDGFALAGGPWITPKESMQKIVSMQTNITGGTGKRYILMQPGGYEGYYEDIACFAIPSESCPMCVNPATFKPVITMSTKVTRDDKGVFRAKEPCWIQYEYPEEVAFRSVEIIPSGNNLQAQRLKMLASTDGKDFWLVKQLTPPRQGWQNTDYNLTYAIPKTEARYFRFEWTPEGTEPGSEDLDAAKWSPVLKLKDIRLSDQLRINQWEGKAGYVWRLADATTEEEVPTDDCPKLKDIIRIQIKNGRMAEPLPEGNWLVVRIGHTSTGHTNATAGGGKGLECDKFSEAAVRKQVGNWFGLFKARPHAGVVKYLHVDSWECGSQNWSDNFAEEFQRRRGYDIIPWLPVMVGIPLESAARSEQVLRDIRQTIDELKNEVFFRTVSDCAREYGVQLSAESVSPTMMSDGMSHYRYADLPMGEFWLNSPTHDKPNDMLDAISGAHVYGKNIVQAEGFTEVRGVWDETPAMIKPLLDRNFCLGMNRLFFHVNTHNPYIDKKPGMTLDGIGLFFQRDQTWFSEARAFVDYITRCQQYLQKGRPVVDIAVYTGDEMPRRALTPDRLVPILPGLFGEARIASERQRLANHGLPMIESPVGVRHAAGILDLKDWVNPLHGYKYDSMNPDGLARWLAEMQNPTSSDMPYYRVLVVPKGSLITPETQARIDSLKRYGITVITEPYQEHTLPDLQTDATLPGLLPDAVLPDGIDFAHRKDGKSHYFFLSNQTDSVRTFRAKLRTDTKVTELIDPLTGHPLTFREQREGAYSCIDITLAEYGSAIVLCGPALTDVWPQSLPASDGLPVGTPIGSTTAAPALPLAASPWTIAFRESGITLKNQQLFDWSQHSDDRIRYFSGHARYTTTFRISKKDMQHATWWLRLPSVKDIAHVWLNGKDCGIAWTAPYLLNISKALKKGKNKLEIEVVNTWHNALRGTDQGKAPYDGIWTNAIYRTKGDGLLPAGMLQAPMLVKQPHGAIRALFEE